jgi:uncharacterized protein (TIGR02217 family)
VSFFEVEFPRNISYKAVGGPGFSTIVNAGFSGQEQRNQNWQFARAKYTISLQTPPPAQFTGTPQQFIDLLQAFFLAVAGKANGFRLYDHKDNTFTNEALVLVSGSTYQLVKRYVSGANTYIRTITKPIGSPAVDYTGTALADSVTFSSGSGTVDYTTGLVSGVSGTPVASGKFHFPVRFDTDDLGIQIEESNIAGGGIIISANSVPLIEVLAPNF